MLNRQADKGIISFTICVAINHMIETGEIAEGELFEIDTG
jgi:hypothetical protein